MEIDIAQVATLARLELSAGEASRLTGELGRVLDYMAQLDQLDTTDVPATTHILPISTPLRADRVTAHLDRGEALSQAPEHDGQAFAVPLVL